jgi:hypothetical protein
MIRMLLAMIVCASIHAVCAVCPHVSVAPHVTVCPHVSEPVMTSHPVIIVPHVIGTHTSTGNVQVEAEDAKPEVPFVWDYSTSIPLPAWLAWTCVSIGGAVLALVVFIIFDRVTHYLGLWD